MDVNTMSKPTFGRDQIVPASLASKRFAEIRRRAKSMPQFISDHNEIDAVILDYQTYEDMYTELAQLREQRFYNLAAQRIKEGDENPNRVSVSLKEAMGKEAYGEYQKIDPDLISDEDLFE